MTPFWGEFIGTMLLLLLGDGVVAGVVLKSSKAENAGWIVITLAWGLAVTMAIYAVGGISGAHLNPAVTLALAAEGSFEWAKVPGYIVAQMLGAFTGAVLVWLHYLPHWGKTEDAGTKLAVFCTGPAIRSAWPNLFSEILGTFVLTAGVLFIGANKFTEGLNPIVVGALVVAIGMSLGGTTGYAINPARDLAPRIAHFLLPIKGKGDSDWAYAPIPVVGPVIGGILGGMFYCAAFRMECKPLFWAATLVTVAVAAMAVRSSAYKA
ncbi:MAG: aquaporin family protein [Lewinellaceae bacterium]|nr:aquaporin family protein [Saprospiraceae bacterium]MCB9339785.1 aquaporin family protein [Lewinellaceae bacterium]